MGNTKLSICYCVYQAPLTFAAQIAKWQTWDPSILSQVEFVIVDDGSSESSRPVVPANHGLNLRLLRVLEDKPWNISGARNLAAKQASSDWLFLCDVDHFLRESTVKAMLAVLDKRSMYFHVSREKGGVKLHPGSNIFLIMRSDFWKVGGYDEDWQGIYGWEDVWLRRCLEYVGVVDHMLPGGVIDVVGVAEIPDASYDLFKKDPAKGRQLYDMKASGKVKRSTSTLRFKWESVI